MTQLVGLTRAETGQLFYVNPAQVSKVVPYSLGDEPFPVCRVIFNHAVHGDKETVLGEASKVATFLSVGTPPIMMPKKPEIPLRD